MVFLLVIFYDIFMYEFALEKRWGTISSYLLFWISVSITIHLLITGFISLYYFLDMDLHVFAFPGWLALSKVKYIAQKLQMFHSVNHDIFQAQTI